jgi:hypothetical protein
VSLIDIPCHKKVHLMLKFPEKNDVKVGIGKNYVLDNVKLVINSKGSLVVVSTAFSVLI